MKKTICMALVLVMALALFAGCGGSGSGGGANDVIKVGWLGPLTGNVAQYGQAVKNGVDLYVEQLNAAGGINGKKIELVSYDEEGDATKAVTGYNSVMDQGVVAIIGSVTTAPTIAVVAESFADNTPMITASATAIPVTFNEETNQVYTNMFRSCFIDSFQGVTMARFAKNVLAADTAAVLYDNGDTYSTGVYDYFVNECAAQGIEVVATESYASGSVDFSGQLTNIAAAKPDVLFLPVYYNDVALIAAQAAAAGITAPMLGVDGWSSVLDAVSDTALVEGAYYCSGYSVEDTRELVVNFLSDYAKKYNGATPNMFDAQGYDAAWILFDAIAAAEKSGKKYGTDEYKQAIIDAMAATNKEFVTGNVSFDSHNDPQKSAAIIQITGGAESFWGNF
ncbi:MAG: ABC transporter substrate-binding protein [Oscillospiraceae bacterium]|nr:ABC transporter substrate-binding protein [Oscillospiraceae bacterium]